jgi:hypothetical protein
VTGFRFDELPEEIEQGLSSWVAQGRVVQGEELKPGKVWRVGEWAVKYFEPRRSAWEFWRADPALRCAEAAFEIAPIKTPRPLLAVCERSRARGRAGSWLAVRFVAGQHFTSAMRSDPASRAALPAFLACMHRHRILHGDLAGRNLLWDGHDWWVIDLEGLRGPLHRLRARSIFVTQWARLNATLGDRGALDPLIGEYVNLMEGEFETSAFLRNVERQTEVWNEHYRRMRTQMAERTTA